MVEGGWQILLIFSSYFYLYISNRSFKLKSANSSKTYVRLDSYLSDSMLKAKVAGKRTLVHKNQAKKWKCCRWWFATIQYLCCAYSVCCCVTVLIFSHKSVVGRMKPKVKSRAALLSRQTLTTPRPRGHWAENCIAQV